MTTLSELGELGLIDRLTRQMPSAPNIVEGIGDDCAVVRVNGQLFLLSCDLFVEGTHFRREYISPEDLGWKAAAACLSDIAAMGGAPMFCLVSLACPSDLDVTFIDELYNGMTGMLTR